MTSALVADLRIAAPEVALVHDAASLQAYRNDEARQVQGGLPAVVVLPTSTAEVAAVLRVATRHRVPVVPRGAGTGLAGGAAAVEGCIVVCTTRMNRVLQMEVDEQYAVVQPGVVTADLDAAAAEHGLWYPPDPSSWRECTIGGNVATNAGGFCCLRYGTTSDHVLGVELVLADGTVLRTGRRTAKGVAGYDLTHLVVGSEGTLGVITGATLRLRPRRRQPATVVALFGDLPAAGAAVLAVLREGLTTTMLEIMDRTTLDAVEELTRSGLDAHAAALLVIQTEAPQDADAVGAACRASGAIEIHATDDAAEADLLLQARRMALPALQRLGSVLLDDVAVPRAAIPALIARTEQIAMQHGVVIGTFGHAGDGNLHPTVVYDEDSMAAANAAFGAVIAAALDLGGTITGEHGVGRLKADWLAVEVGEASLRVQAAVKAAVDPFGLLNPGAVLAAPADG